MTKLVCTHPEPYDEERAADISSRFQCSLLLARALIRRGLTEDAAIGAFLSPQMQPLLGPAHLPDMQKAAERIQAAIARRERICVYGDYDADGVIATAILTRFLQTQTDNVRTYIPSRHDEGYGMNADAVRALHEDGVQLIVTVDNGVSAFDEIALCSSLGMDVVVTDHHRVQGKLPDCCAVVATTRMDPVSVLCGAGVAMLLTMALSGGEADRGALALAAVATIADVVPLVRENRIIAAKGLALVPEQKGLSALMRAAGIAENRLDSTSAAYSIAPRLNAAGRMGDAGKALSLLLSDDDEQCLALAAALDAANRMRREEESHVNAQAEKMIQDGSLFLRGAILVCGSGWNKGVLGIVASRITERYHRPSIVFAMDAEGVLSGSGRSIDGIDLFAALTAFRDRFLRFGGHAGAAGVTMRACEFERFREDFCRAIEDAYPPEAFEKKCFYEETVSLSALNREIVTDLRRLAPFGAGNPEPVFCLSGVDLRLGKKMGKDGQHFSAELVQGGAAMRMVAFGFGEASERLTDGTKQDVLATVSVHAFMGRENVELTASEIHAHDPRILKFYDAITNEILYNIERVSVCDLLTPHLEPLKGAIRTGDYALDEMRLRYRTLLHLLSGGGIPLLSALNRLPLATLLSLFVFWELGFFAIKERGKILRPVDGCTTKPLEKSGIYRFLTECDASIDDVSID